MKRQTIAYTLAFFFLFFASGIAQAADPARSIVILGGFAAEFCRGLRGSAVRDYGPQSLKYKTGVIPGHSVPEPPKSHSTATERPGPMGPQKQTMHPGAGPFAQAWEAHVFNKKNTPEIFATKRFGQYRDAYEAVRITRKVVEIGDEKFIVRRMETVTDIDGRPPGLYRHLESLIPGLPPLRKDSAHQDLWARWEGLAPDQRARVTPEVLDQATDALVAEGQKRQRELIDQILEPVIRDYREDRGWSETKVEALRKEAYATLSRTAYTTFHRMKPDGSEGPMISSMGADRADVGAVAFFNEVTKSWEMRYGQFGASFLASHPEYHDRAVYHMLYGVAPASLWNSPVELLQAEALFGRAVPPALVPDRATGKSALEIEAIEPGIFTQNLPPGVKPDLSKGLYFYTGSRFEAVKFWLAPELRKPKSQADRKTQDLAREIAVTSFGMEMFGMRGDADFRLNGQVSLTYNDVLGARYYRGLGYEPYAGWDPIVEQGVGPDGQPRTYHWRGLIATPRQLLSAHEKEKKPADTDFIGLVKGFAESLKWWR